MSNTINKYLIRRRDECCNCPECGMPLDLDDYAYEIRYDATAIDAGYCSRSCAQKADDRRAEMADDEADAA